MSRTETKGERARTTTTKQNTSNSSYLVEEVNPQILSLGTNLFVRYLNWMHIFKRWFTQFFLRSGLRIEYFYCQLELNNNYLYSFGHKEKADLFVCFALKCERTSAFLIHLPNWFSLCLNSDKKILPLCYKHVIPGSSRKSRGKSHQLPYVFRSLFKAPKRYMYMYLSVGADLV